MRPAAGAEEGRPSGASPAGPVGRTRHVASAVHPLTWPWIRTVVARLPRGELGIPELDDDPSWHGWSPLVDLKCRREQTRRACVNDLRAWYAWCLEREPHPLAARRHDVALWARQLAATPGRSGKAEALASIARRLSCLSSFYRHAVEVDVLDDNPVANVKRPRVANASMSVGLTRDELEALLDAAQPTARARRR